MVEHYDLLKVFTSMLYFVLKLYEISKKGGSMIMIKTQVRDLFLINGSHDVLIVKTTEMACLVA